MTDRESDLSRQTVIDSYQAPWMLKRKSTPQLRITLHQIKDGLKFWEANPHQNQRVDKAVAQHKHAVKITEKYLKQSEDK